MQIPTAVPARAGLDVVPSNVVQGGAFLIPPTPPGFHLDESGVRRLRDQLTAILGEGRGVAGEGPAWLLLGRLDQALKADRLAVEAMSAATLSVLVDLQAFVARAAKQ